MKNFPRLLGAAFFLFLFYGAAPLPSLGDDASGTIDGWGTAEFNDKGDLGKAIEESRQKARLDLSANILTFVNVKTTDETIQSNGKVTENFKQVTVTKVVQLLREVNLHQPQVDYQNHLVTTHAEISRAVARQIIQDAMARLKERREQYRQNMEQLKMLTGNGKYYYKKKILQLDNQKDLDRIGQETDKLKAELIHDQLQDIQDVRNNVKTVFFRNFPDDSQTTLLAYIEITRYNDLVQNYQTEIYNAKMATSGDTYGQIAMPQNPDSMAKVAESTLPAMVYNIIGWGFEYSYVAGVDPEFDIGLSGFYFHAQDIWGFRAGLGFDFGAGGNQITRNNPYNGAGYTNTYDFHFPVEADGYLYFSEVRSDKDIPFLKLGLLGDFSWASANEPDSGNSVDLKTNFAVGESMGVGMTLFRKQAGVFLKTIEFGLDCRLINNGLYGEGGQVGILGFVNFGV